MQPKNQMYAGWSILFVNTLHSYWTLGIIMYFNTTITNNLVYIQIQDKVDCIILSPGLVPAWLPEALSEPLKRPASEKSTTLSSDAW